MTDLSDAEQDGETTKASAEEDVDEENTCSTDEPPAPLPPKKSSRRKHIGSLHGLTEESKGAIKWVHQIPYYLKPLIPGLFNLCNSAFPQVNSPTCHPIKFQIKIFAQGYNV